MILDKDVLLRSRLPNPSAFRPWKKESRAAVLVTSTSAMRRSFRASSLLILVSGM